MIRAAILTAVLFSASMAMACDDELPPEDGCPLPPRPSCAVGWVMVEVASFDNRYGPPTVKKCVPAADLKDPE